MGAGQQPPRTLTVEPAGLTSVSATPTTFEGSASTTVTGTVSLNGPPTSAGAVVTLTSSDPTVASVPPSVTIHSGSTTVTFAVKHSKVTTVTSVKVTATYGSVSKTVTLTVNP